MIWKYPLKIQTLDTENNETGYRTFEKKQEFVDFMWDQFKIPGEYNLKNTHRWKDAGNQYSSTVTRTKLYRWLLYKSN